MPGMVLMERAALESLKVLRKHEKVREGAKVFLLAGYGNNGGDGLALARLLAEAGARVEVCLVGNPKKASESWRQQRKILESYPVSVTTYPWKEGAGEESAATRAFLAPQADAGTAGGAETAEESRKEGSAERMQIPGKGPSSRAYDILVDALFGVGLSRDLEGEYARAVEELNGMEGFKLALDLPSGICSDDGRILGTAFRADATVTFGFGKRGLFLYPGCEYAGEVHIADIGIGPGAFFGREPGMFYLEEPFAALLPRREKAGNKGTFGKALLVAGSFRMAGAAILCGEACCRTGAGMVKIVTDPENRVILQERLPEALFGVYEDLLEALSWCSGICIGPGLGKSGSARAALETVIRGDDGRYGGKSALDIPLIIDADGINLLSETPALIEELARQGAEGREIVLTPHIAEFARLYGALFGRENTPETPELKRGAAEYGMRAAERLSAVIVLKDARTFVCRKGQPVCLNVAGNSGMATAGSGDVLAGILAGLTAQGVNAFDAACRGVRLHGLAGDLAAEKLGEHGMIAGDICRQIQEKDIGSVRR